MTASALSTLTRLVLPATLLSGTVFSALTAPLALYGSEQVQLRANEQPLFSGKLKEVAGPYVGVAALLSVGVGVASVSVSGWRASARKSNQLEDKVIGLKEKLRDKEAQVQELMLSDSKLEDAGLTFFLQDGDEVHVPQVSPDLTAVPVPVRMVNSGHQPVEQPIRYGSPAPVTHQSIAIGDDRSIPARSQPSPVVVTQPSHWQSVQQPVVEPVQPTVAYGRSEVPVSNPVPAGYVHANPVPSSHPHSGYAQPAPMQPSYAQTGYAPQPVSRSHGVVVQTEAPVIESLVFGGTPATHAHSPRSPQVNAVVTPLPAAQAFLSFARVPTPTVPVATAAYEARSRTKTGADTRPAVVRVIRPA